MEKKTARLTILIDPDKKAAFEELCMQQDITPSQVLRQLIRLPMALITKAGLPNAMLRKSLLLNSLYLNRFKYA